MNIDELVSRINFLYSKSKSTGLTEEEKLEQNELRRRYIDKIKNNLRAQLNNIDRSSEGERLN